MDDPAEEELAGAAENIDVLVEHEKVQPHVFYTPHNLGALPDVWLQAKLTISLKQAQDKWARLLVAVARGAVVERADGLHPIDSRSRCQELDHPICRKSCPLP